MRGLRELHIRVSHGSDLRRSENQPRYRGPQRVRGMLRLLQWLEPGASEPDHGADDALDFQGYAPALRAGAGRLPYRRVRARQAGMAARRAARLFRSTRAA